MITRLILLGALLAASVSFLLASDKPKWPPYIQGRNRTVLFVTNKEHGLSNSHVATASALLENFPDIQVHFASFRGMGDKLKRVSEFARAKTPTASNIIFHELKGLSYQDAVRVINKDVSNVIHPPASAGIARLTADMQHWISPWTADDHLELYKEIGIIIDKVDPAVVVLDTAFRPAIDITRDQNRQHAFITPNTLVENFIGNQPYGTMFWKYPALGSGFPFPVPLRNIPENIYLNLRCIYAVARTPALAAKKAVLKEHGVKDPINMFAIHRHDVPWISMSTEDAMVPVQYVPPNVTCAGPIILSSAPAAQQDAKLADWVKKAPTVLVNLGSGMTYSENRAAAMAEALEEVLSKTDVQIIWKFNKLNEYPNDFLTPLQRYIDNDRLILSNWLTVDPYSLLQTGDIIATVHHGGSNCYHEGIAAGVSQVVLPLWVDLYNFAALVETLGVGVWGCKPSSPEWTAECLSKAILKTVDGSQESLTMREKAKQLGDKINLREKGRDVAAKEIAKLAYVASPEMQTKE